MPRPRLKLQPQDEFDPAEPSRPASSNQGSTAPVQVTQQPAEPAAQSDERAQLSSDPVVTIEPPAPPAFTAVQTPDQAPQQPAQPQRPAGERGATSRPYRSAVRQPITVPFTNRLSMKHRDLLDQLATEERNTLRGVIENALDLYKAQVYPELPDLESDLY
jgi:hypothetical protein